MESASDMQCRSFGLVEEGHALDPELQRLPVNACDDAEREGRIRGQGTRQRAAGHGRQIAGDRGEQQRTAVVVVVDAPDPAPGMAGVRLRKHEAEAVAAFDAAEGRDVKDLAGLDRLTEAKRLAVRAV